VCGNSKTDSICEIRDRYAVEIRTVLGYDPETVITGGRYGYIAGLVREVVTRTRQNAVELSDKIDSVLTHRFWAYPIFIAFMWLLFQATFKLGEYPMGWIESGITSLMQATQVILPEGLLRDMISDGIIAGVGGVIVFLPNILILFLGISIMEDTGYMARAAFTGMALLFKLTLFRKSEDMPFVMELPPYRIPTGRSILIHMWQKAGHYLKKMGGVVLVFSVILWWAGAFPRAPHIEAIYDSKIAAASQIEEVAGQELHAQIASIEAEKHAAVMEQTYIGRIGKFLAPAVKPFGSDWRGAVSLVTGFVAKEIVVGSMGVLYAVGIEEDEESEGLRGKIRQFFTPLSGFAFMIFVLLYTPCIVALVTVIRELKNWRWSVFSVTYQVTFAWIAATVVFQAGKFLGIE
jgi:ferrous iron transport protein B